MPRSRHHGDATEAADVRGQSGGTLRQAGLHLSARGRRLSLPRWRAAAISLYERRGRQDIAALLDNRVPELLAQTTRHNGARAADHAMGARASAGRRTAAPRRKPASDASAP